MRTFFTFFLMFIFIISCAEEPATILKQKEIIDYYQFDELMLDKYGINASVMIPNETAGIGASFEILPHAKIKFTQNEIWKHRLMENREK